MEIINVIPRSDLTIAILCTIDTLICTGSLEVEKPLLDFVLFTPWLQPGGLAPQIP
jgi:hypothetical protein